MSKHLIDHRSAPTTRRIVQFLRIARGPRAGWHRSHGPVGTRRLVEFLRIARGRAA